VRARGVGEDILASTVLRGKAVVAARMVGDLCEVEERNGVDVVLCEDSCVAIVPLVDKVATGIIYKVVAVALVFGVAAIVDTMSVSTRKKGVVAIACTSMFVDVNIRSFQHPSCSVYWWVCNCVFGLAVTCDCPLPPPLMQVPRCCKASLMLCVLVSSMLVVGTRSARVMLEARSCRLMEVQGASASASALLPP